MFEEFTACLLDFLYPQAQVFRVGGTGHKQGGYDVLAERNGKFLAGAQSKRVKEFWPSDVDAAVQAATTKVSRSFIFMSSVARPSVRDAIRVHKGWKLWDRDDLSREVRKLPRHQSIALVRQFFPELLFDFLGVNPGPWLEPEQYLRNETDGVVYTHKWQLVGRVPVIDGLADFAAGGRERVGLLIGRGGIGKTKILTELCDRLGATGEVAVRLLERDRDVAHDAFEQLPDAGPLLVIIDDAHDANAPLGRIVAGVHRTNPAAKVLLSLRPYGEAQLRQELRDAGVHIGETSRFMVPDLDFEAAQDLAREALDREVKHFAPRLAAAAYDCPLLIVTGAAQINRGALDPRAFERDEGLRVALSDLLADTFTAQAADALPFDRRLLCAVAAYQPVRLSDAGVQQALETLTGAQLHDISERLVALEDSGLLLSRGDSIRVVPDLLGDALLARSFRHPSGVDTGYLNLAADAVAASSALGNLIVNAGRVDWQETTNGKTDSGLIEPLWAFVVDQFQTGNAPTRLAILELAPKIAVFQPRRTLALVVWAMDHPAEETTAEIGFGFTHTYTSDDVRGALVPILRVIAYHSEYLPRTAEILWNLALADSRPTNSHPDHPLRVLAEVASHTYQSPTERQSILAAQVERWLARAPEKPAEKSPLMILRKLMAIRSEDHVWTAQDTLSIRSFTVTPTPELLALRQSVLDLTFRELGSSDIVRAAAAVELLGQAVSLSYIGQGAGVPGEIKTAWFPHHRDVLNQLRAWLSEHAPSVAVAAGIRHELQWLTDYGPDELRQDARAVVAQIPKTPDNELGRALRGGPVDPLDDPEDFMPRHEASLQLFADTATLVDDWTDAKIAERLCTLHDEQLTLPTSGAEGHAWQFTYDLITRRPAVGEAHCERALSEPSNAAIGLVPVALAGLGQAAGERAVYWGIRLAASTEIALARAAAEGLGARRDHRDLIEGEKELLHALATHDDPIVRGNAVAAVRYLLPTHKALAVDLLTVTFPDAPLWEIALALLLPGRLTWQDFSSRQQHLLLEALLRTPSIDSYELGQLLAKIAQATPLAVVELLEKRVDRADERGIDGTYSPLPHIWYTPLPFRDTDEFPALLVQVREWVALSPTAMWKAFLGGEVFAAVAGQFDDQVIAVIDEYLSSPDLHKIRVLALLLSKAPGTLVWDFAFTRRCLRAADRCGDESLELMRGALHSAVNRIGGVTGTPGQPFAEHIDIRDKANVLAARCTRGTVEESFYRDLLESAEGMIEWATVDPLPPRDRRQW